jgi:DNA-binding PadR family transcriptional regulator
MKFVEPKFCKFFLGLANPRKSVFALGKETYGSPRTTYAALDQLEAWGLVEVNNEVSNKKQLIVTITEKGRDKMKSIYELIDLT